MRDAQFSIGVWNLARSDLDKHPLLDLSGRPSSFMEPSRSLRELLAPEPPWEIPGGSGGAEPPLEIHMKKMLKSKKVLRSRGANEGTMVF